MKPRLSALFSLIALVTGLCFPVSVMAGEYPTCAPNTTCQIGEFLYDDEYSPIATADCHITSRDPANNLFINSATMSAQADGWYSYLATPSATEGVYRTQICCTAGDDYLCLDKTFQVRAATGADLSASDIWNFSGRSLDDPDSIADSVWASSTRSLTTFGTLPFDIWNYSGRTLTGFGTLIADIWSHSSKSLTSFGSLVADVWNNGTRTITGGGDTNNNTYQITNNNSGPVTNNNSGSVTNNNSSNITNQQISSLLSISAENQKLLEQIVNKPVIKTFIEEGDLQSKLEKTRSITNRLYSGTQELKSRGELLELKWNNLTTAEVQNELETINKLLKEDSLRENSSIIASADWLKSAWNSTITLNLSDQVQAAQSKVQNLLNDLSLFGKPSSPLVFKSALTHLQNLDLLVGTSLSSEEDTTLFGYLKSIEQLVFAYQRQSKTAQDALSKLDTFSKPDLEKTITDLTTEVLSNSLIPSASSVLVPPVKPDQNTAKNKILNLLALINTNLNLLASQTGKVVNNVWLEEGSIVFRAVATNPSKSASQSVPLEIYLPEEIKQEQIIQKSQELSIDFNQEDNRLMAVGEVELSPQETRTFFVEVEDIWKYSPEEIDSLKKQVDDIVDTLKGTSYYAQSASLHGDIDVALDKILLRQKEAITPESRIKTYRESRLDMVGIGQKIDALKLITAQAGANNSIFGFVGGVQAIAVWGLIIILTSGFVFLALYMRTLRLEHFAVADTKPSLSKNNLLDTDSLPPNIPHRHPPSKHRTLSHLTIFLAATLLAGGFGSYASSIAIKRSSQPVQMLTPLDSKLNFRTLGVTSDSSESTPSAQFKNGTETTTLNQ